jgi:hypothetical protein
MKKERLLGVSLKYGLITFAALIAYFFIMKLLRLIYFQELRVFNGVIIFIGVIFAISKLKEIKGERINYFYGMGGGMLTTLIAIVPFSIFVLIYLLSDHTFLVALRERSAFGNLINPFIGAFVNFMEGMASGLIASFMVMQYYKPSILKGMNKRKREARKAAL